MNHVKTIEIASPAASRPPRNDARKDLFWADNPAVQKLLDVITSTMAEEYIQIAKQNPNIFTKGGQE